MLIIVEGPDGAGKTTLINELQRQLEARGQGTIVSHSRPPKRHPLDEYEVPMLQYRANDQYTLICDRWHWGEAVYPTLLDRPTLLTRASLLHIDLALAARGAIVVFVTAQSETIAKRLAERGDDMIYPSHAELMSDLFWRASELSTLPRFYYDGEGPLNQADEIIQFAMERNSDAKLLNRFVTYVGPRWPKVILVGDVRGGDPETHGDLPAFMPYRGSCGAYLLDAVCAVAQPHELAKLGVVNANDVDDVQSLWHKLQRPTLVPLGRNAERTISRFAPSRRYVHDIAHPQYQKRFQYLNQKTYGEQIVRNWRKKWS